jgi:DNA/RNA-binding domain of Phe-tRNA-synthetase-like protein
MKFNKKMMAVHLLASFLITESAMARITAGERKSSSGDSSSSSGNSRGQPPSSYKVSEATKDNYQSVQGNSATCDSNMDKETYFPLELFPAITRDEGAQIDISVRPNNKIVVKIPPTINICGAWNPELRQDKVTKNATVFMRLSGTKYEPILDAGGKPVLDKDGKQTYKETKDQSLNYADLEACLSRNGITDANGKMDYSKIPSNGYSESVTTFDYDFDKKADIKKTVSVSFGYPKSYNSPDGYQPVNGINENASVPGEACMLAANISEKPIYINKGKDVLIDELNKTCTGGDAQKIAEARANIGNYDALKDVADKIRQELDAGYLIAVKTDVKRIDDEMRKIEEKLNKEKDTLDEASSKKLIRKYADLAKELNTKFLDPAIMRLDNLMQKRAKLDDEDPQTKGIDDEIKKLNEDISQFAKRNPTSFASVYSVMEKYAINDDAKVIEDIRLKSYLYSKVYAGKQDEKRGKQMTFEAANQKQYQQLQKFDKTLTDWSDVYLVGQGNTFPIKKVERERQASIDRMNTRWAAYEKKESTDYANYCGVGMLGSVKNPVKCKAWADGLNKRRTAELKKREKDLNFVKGRNDKLEKMGMNYNEYQRQAASKEDANEDGLEPYGSSYTSYEDNFSDRFPGYYGPTTTTTYDASNYNMGGMSNSMQMGQQQMYMPQQQMQQGQFSGQLQMGQGQARGGWPSI